MNLILNLNFMIYLYKYIIRKFSTGLEGADTYTYDEEIESICFMASQKLDKQGEN